MHSCAFQQSTSSQISCFKISALERSLYSVCFYLIRAKQMAMLHKDGNA
jgi:hypothetical protein